MFLLEEGPGCPVENKAGLFRIVRYRLAIEKMQYIIEAMPSNRLRRQTFEEE